MELTVCAYDDLDDPNLRDAWLGLQVEPGTSIFSTLQWCQSWANTLGRNCTPWVLTACNRDGVVGLWPLCVDRSASPRWVKFLGSDGVRGDHLDVLCKPAHHDAVLSAFLGHLQRDTRMFDGLLLDGIGVESKSNALLEQWCKENRYRTVNREIQMLPHVNLPGTFDEYLATLSHKRRSAVRRSRRKLADMGAEIVESHSRDDVDELLAKFFELHVVRWRSEGVESRFAEPQMQAFMQDFCALAADNGWFRGYTLRDGGKTDGVLIAFHFGPEAYFYQIARDAGSRVLNAGMMLITASIEQAIRESLTRYDFLRGDESYKFRLAKSSSQQATVMIGVRRPATTAVATELLSQRFKRIASRLLGDDRWTRLKDRLRRRRAVRSAALGSTTGANP